MGKLYVVDVVVNWDDVTLRARRTLDESVLVVAQGRADVGQWLADAGIGTPVLFIGDDAPSGWVTKVLDALKRGDVAWISLGAERNDTLLNVLLARGVKVLPVPGASAPIVGLVSSGLPGDRFTYVGELPSSSQARRDILSRVARERHTLVCTVRDAELGDVLGDVDAVLGNRMLAVQAGSQVWRGYLWDAPAWSGTFELVIAGATHGQTWTKDRVREQVRVLLESGVSIRDTARLVAQRSGWRRKAVYRIAIQIEGR
jgi:16S rRNA (cytidine1402-2'-O)-methyltransferase